MADLRTPAEKRYDDLKNGAAYVKPAASQDDQLTSLLTDLYGSDAPLSKDEAKILALMFPKEVARAEQFMAGYQDGLAIGAAIVNDDEDAVAAWIDQQWPAVLDVATARLQALGGWEGEIITHDNGNTLRYPPLENAVIGQLEDGTDVYGDFDNDDRPLVVVVEWEDFSIVACGGGPGGAGANLIDETDETGREYDHITLAQWARLKRLVASGVVDQALHFAKAWHAQREEDTDTLADILDAIDGGE